MERESHEATGSKVDWHFSVSGHRSRWLSGVRWRCLGVRRLKTVNGCQDKKSDEAVWRVLTIVIGHSSYLLASSGRAKRKNDQGCRQDRRILGHVKRSSEAADVGGPARATHQSGAAIASTRPRAIKANLNCWMDISGCRARQRS
jgi:hypothetical protein